MMRITRHASTQQVRAARALPRMPSHPITPAVMPLACRIAIAALWLALTGAAQAGATPTPVRAEIDALLARLESSGCRFGRNDEWYAGADARAHLLRKLEYVERVGTIRSTEQFIETAATKSSVSGAPYQVQCGSAAAVPSGPWLSGELKGLRGAGARAAR
jgi:hypothetical protein